ncbi:MAG: hypothetical protein ABSA93_35425, partial [Streptosporangiaceae bacterium]
MLSTAERNETRACTPWCVKHSGGVRFSERHQTDSGNACLVRSAMEGRTRVMVYIPDPKGYGPDALIQLSAHDARDLAEMLRVLGHSDL